MTFRIDHRYSPNFMLLHQSQDLSHCTVGTYRNRILNHSALRPLHLSDMLCLLLNSHILVQDSYPTFLSDCYGQLIFGDCIHGSGDNRSIQFDFSAKKGTQIDFSGEDF